MKKLLLLALIFVSVTSMAQLRKDRDLPSIGGHGAVNNGDGTFNMQFDFNSDAALGAKISDNSFKALQSIMLSAEAPVGMPDPVNNTKTNKIGSGANFYRLLSNQALLDYATVDTLKAYSTSQQFWKPVAAICNLNDSDFAWVNFPGMYKRSLFAFRANLTNIGVIGSDLSFELMTYDKGNTGKAATYKMIVDLGGKINNGFGNSGFNTVASFDTISSTAFAGNKAALGTSALYVIDNIYTTSLDSTMGKIKINLAEKLGLTPQEINGKYVAVMLYTKGTGTNVAPGVYEPALGVDNIKVTYIPASWDFPVEGVTNAYVNHNNGVPTTTVSDDFSGGTPVDVVSTASSPVRIMLTSKNRTSDIILTEDNPDNVHNPKFEFPATGAVKSKDAAGNFTVDVPYVLTPSTGTSEYNLHIPLPAGKTFSNDTLQVSINAVGLDLNQIAATRLEITNGTRFWYNVSAKGAAITGAPAQQAAPQLTIYNQDRSIVAKNATSKVTIINANGQVVRAVTPSAAARGIALPEGAYVVKTGETVQKVIVK